MPRGMPNSLRNAFAARTHAADPELVAQRVPYVSPGKNRRRNSFNRNDRL
jgi:hypothetical protein